MQQVTLLVVYVLLLLDDEGLLNISCGTISGVSSITGCSSQIDIGSSVTVEGDFQVEGLATLSTFSPFTTIVNTSGTYTLEAGNNRLLGGVSDATVTYNLPVTPEVGERYQVVQQYQTGASPGVSLIFSN